MNKKLLEAARRIVASTSVNEQMQLLATHGIDICEEYIKIVKSKESKVEKKVKG